MRLLIAILLFISLQSQGQIVRAHPYYRPPVSGCSYLLDQYSGAAAAYSLRKVRCAYSGSLIRVRRSSDNTESDIGATSNGDLDTAALKAFIGTGGSDDGAIVVWYDQSGNANNATQSTGGSQPLIMDNGVILRQNTKPIIKFDGSSDYFVIGSEISSQQPFSSFYPQIRPGTTTIGMWVTNTTSGAGYTPVIYQGVGLFISHSGCSQYGRVASENSTSFILLSGFATANNTYEVYKNGASLTITNAAESGTNNFKYIGRRGSEYSNASCPEIILYTSDKTSSRTGIEANINSYYSIY